MSDISLQLSVDLGAFDVIVLVLSGVAFEETTFEERYDLRKLLPQFAPYHSGLHPIIVSEEEHLDACAPQSENDLKQAVLNLARLDAEADDAANTTPRAVFWHITAPVLAVGGLESLAEALREAADDDLNAAVKFVLVFGGNNDVDVFKMARDFTDLLRVGPASDSSSEYN